MSPFFFKIPGHNCHCFSTGDASGSVSQAANIIEAIQAGAKLLLIDEDKGATNFMICDSKMRQIVPEEIIIPFTDRIDELIKKKQISCILVIGGSSEYFHYADNILVMKNYQPNTIDSDQEIMLRCDIKHQRSLPLIKFSDKYINLSDDDITKSLFSIVNAEKIKKVIVGQCSADISALTSIKDDCQLHGIAVGVYNAMLMSLTDRKSLKRLVEDSMSVFWVDRINEGYALDKMFRHWFVSEVRPLDVIITMNRMRGFDFSQQDEVGHE
jgi:predicted ABC-class ATPase